MKSISFFLILVFTITLSINAQNCESCRYNKSGGKIAILGGLSIVDDGFTEDYNPFKIQERWQYGYFVGLEYLFSDKISFQVSYSNNIYKVGKTINGGNVLREEIEYSSINFHGVYSFDSLFELRSLQPYIIGGAGSTRIKVKDRITINLGAGVRIWLGEVFYKRKGFHENLAIDIKSLGLFNLPIGSGNGRQLQYTAGLLYRF